MEWIVYAIWFGCGYMCREIILRGQLTKAKRIVAEVDRQMKEAGIDVDETINKIMKERANGNNKHSK